MCTKALASCGQHQGRSVQVACRSARGGFITSSTLCPRATVMAKLSTVAATSDVGKPVCGAMAVATLGQLSKRFVCKLIVGVRSGHVVCGGVVEDPTYSQLAGGVFEQGLQA